MAVKVKKAKLAHEKGKGQQQTSGLGGFTFNSVVEVVDYAGNEVAVVDLDGKGTLGIVDRHFVVQDGEAYKPALLACPAAYDVTARSLAIERHAAYTAN